MREEKGKNRERKQDINLACFHIAHDMYVEYVILTIITVSALNHYADDSMGLLIYFFVHMGSKHFSVCCKILIFVKNFSSTDNRYPPIGGHLGTKGGLGDGGIRLAGP